MRLSRNRSLLLLLIFQIFFCGIPIGVSEFLPKKYKLEGHINLNLDPLATKRVMVEYAVLNGSNRTDISYRVDGRNYSLGIVLLEGLSHNPSVIKEGLIAEFEKIKDFATKQVLIEQEKRVLDLSFLLAQRGGLKIESVGKQSLEGQELGTRFGEVIFSEVELTGVHRFSKLSLALFFSLLGVFFGCLLLLFIRSGADAK